MSLTVVSLGLEAVAAAAIARLREVAPLARVLVLSTYHSDADIVAAVEAGADGYLLKDAPRPELLAAVRATAAGQAVLSPPVAARLMGRVRHPQKLAEREPELLTLVSAR